MPGLTRVAGAALAAATACGGASSPFGDVTTEAFLGAPPGGGGIFGFVLGGGLGGTTSMVCTGGRAGSGGTGSGGATGIGTGSLLGDAWAGRGGAAS
jgi:hypothetical protein